MFAFASDRPGETLLVATGKRPGQAVSGGYLLPVRWKLFSHWGCVAKKHVPDSNLWYLLSCCCHLQCAIFRSLFTAMSTGKMQTQHGRVLGACFERAVTGPQIWKLRSREKREWCCEELGVACEASELSDFCFSFEWSNFLNLWTYHIACLGNYDFPRSTETRPWKQIPFPGRLSLQCCPAKLRTCLVRWEGRRVWPINLFLSFSMLWCFSNCEVSVGVGGLLSLKEPISMKWIIVMEFAYQTKPPTSTTWLHQHPYLISSRSLAKKKFCCKTKGVACKASWKYWSLMFFFYI